MTPTTMGRCCPLDTTMASRFADDYNIHNKALSNGPHNEVEISYRRGDPIGDPTADLTGVPASLSCRSTVSDSLWEARGVLEPRISTVPRKNIFNLLDLFSVSVPASELAFAQSPRNVADPSGGKTDPKLVAFMVPDRILNPRNIWVWILRSTRV